MAADALSAPAPRRGLSRLALLAYAVAAVVILADQASKAWVLGPLHLQERGSIAVAAPIAYLTYTANPGVSFGIFNNGAAAGRWLLTLFSVAVAVGLAVWARRAARALVALSVGLIMGGALGNAVDRVRLGVVTDFLDFHGLHFPWIFNVADSAISVGVAALLLESVLAPKTAAQRP